jgi:hypothetical protein
LDVSSGQAGHCNRQACVRQRAELPKRSRVSVNVASHGENNVGGRLQGYGRIFVGPATNRRPFEWFMNWTGHVKMPSDSLCFGV